MDSRRERVQTSPAVEKSVTKAGIFCGSVLLVIFAFVPAAAQQSAAILYEQLVRSPMAH